MPRNNSAARKQQRRDTVKRHQAFQSLGPAPALLEQIFKDPELLFLEHALLLDISTNEISEAAYRAIVLGEDKL